MKNRKKVIFFTKKHVGIRVHVINDNNLSLITMMDNSLDLRVSYAY